MREYDPQDIEQKWQKTWEESGMFATSDAVDGKENHLTLVEFPYPSGNLHVGHWYAFSIPDIFVRYQRMNGKNVLFPIGFDAFGLPAENAAIKRGLNPREWTLSNIEYMRAQLRTMGSSYDWSREVVTCEPLYYRWTQWLFLKLLEKGLAYQKETPANWCPSCKTVLANEQVVAGHCERCDSIVEKRLMKQWNLKITDYAERLLTDLDPLPWPEPIKEAQRNWIGKSEGAEIKFEIRSTKSEKDQKEEITVFTTRPDTLFGATYVVVAPEHPILSELLKSASNTDEVLSYVQKTKNLAEIDRIAEGREKTGVKIEGVMAVNPANQEEVPVYVADYVLGSYGTGAVMAVPAHDERDWEFAKKFGLPLKEVVAPLVGEHTGTGEHRDVVKAVIIKDGKVLMVKNWDRLLLPGGSYEAGENDNDVLRREIVEETSYTDFTVGEYLGRVDFGSYISKSQNKEIRRCAAAYRVDIGEQELRTFKNPNEESEESMWVDIRTAMTESIEGIFIERALSDQLTPYVGTGVLINSGSFNGILSEDSQKKITDSVGGQWVIKYKLRDWGISRQRYWGCPIPVIHCPSCGAVAVPEKDLPVVLPEISDYLPTGEGKSPLGKAIEWMNVPCPQCGGKAERETDTLDTFIDSSWYYLRYTDPKNTEAFADIEKQKQWMPVDFYSGGAEHTTMHLLYSRFFNKALFDLGLVTESEPYVRRMNRGLILGPDGNKMSKSKGNVIDPDEIVKKLGADTVRLYLAFIGPYNEVGAYPWSPDGVVGARRFIERSWRLMEKIDDETVMTVDVEVALHQTIKKVSDSIDSFKFNTGVSALMTLVNVFEKETHVSRESYEMFLRLLAPYAPHVAEELWHELGHTTSVHLESWPTYDPTKLTSGEVTIAVQVGGKVRGTVTCPQGTSEATVLALARDDAKIAPWVEKGPILRVIYVPDKLINIVVGGD